MKDRILSVLGKLRSYALQRGHDVELFYQEEDSSLMRFANSAISLNTNEHLIRLTVTAHLDRQRASYGLITSPDDTDGMTRAIDAAAEMVQHAQPLTYQPTVPLYGEAFSDESAYDAALAQMSNEAKLDYVNNVVQGLETADLKLSGIFSSGTNVIALMNTRAENSLYFQTSDAQVTLALAHTALKWEVIAEQSAQQAADLDPSGLRRDLSVLTDHYTHAPGAQLPLGRYDVVFGPAATAELISVMNWIGHSGGSLKRGYSFLNEEQVGHRVFSNLFTLVDDPEQAATFPFRRDFTGMPRRAYPIVQDGVFQGFLWSQDDADEFGAKPTGHTVTHKSLVLRGGDRAVRTLTDLVSLSRQNDVLYIPFLHYMNIVNPSAGIVTASSRFGSLLLKQDGSVVVPYNVRLTQSLLDIFGDKVDWLSDKTTAYNTSDSYGARNPTAVLVPQFIQIRGLEISHSNASY